MVDWETNGNLKLYRNSQTHEVEFPFVCPVPNCGYYMYLAGTDMEPFALFDCLGNRVLRIYLGAEAFEVCGNQVSDNTRRELSFVENPVATGNYSA